MLPKSRVLVAEDEPLTALDIAATVRETGGEVLGPVASVSEAFVLLAEDHIDGAILDCNLRDGEITPIAEVLLERDVPVVLHTGSDMPLILQRHRKALPLYRKPTAPLVLARCLAQRILEEQSRRCVPMHSPSPLARARR